MAEPTPARRAPRRRIPEPAPVPRGLATEPEAWVVVESGKGPWTFHSRLHRVTCLHVSAARPERVYPYPDDSTGHVSEAWIYTSGNGFENACRACCPGLAF
jgi:hypothetical protein